MATQIKRRTGTTAEHSTFTGAASELTVNSTTNTVHVHDGTTAGGHPLAKSSEVALKAPIASPTFTGNFTSTGIDDNATSTKLTIADTGVTIGSAINTAAITLNALYGIAGEAYSALRWNNSSFAGGDSEIRNVVNGASSVGSSLEFHTEQTGTGVLTERMSIGNSGNVKVSAGNLVIGTSGKGIDFSAAGGSAAGSTSAVLDDYEEGTWTPSLSTGTHTYTTQLGTYTKIGRVVTVKGDMELSARGASVSELGIKGLPFVGDTTPYLGSFNWVSEYTEDGLLPAAVQPTGCSVEGTTAYLRTGYDPTWSYNINSLAASGSVRFIITYTV